MSDIKPDAKSSDFLFMEPFWNMTRALLDGTAAVRAAGTTYLPQFSQEHDDDYKIRLQNAKLTNIYSDIVENLSAKPFSEKLVIEGEAIPPQLTDLTEDIDGRGNNLHVFASNVFHGGVNNGLDWILVDHPPVSSDEIKTKADEKRAGVRPFWVRIEALNMLAVYTGMINGTEEIIHARFREDRTERDGFEESTIERVRVLTRDKAGEGSYGPARFEVWEYLETDKKGKTWQMVDEGPLSVGIITLVPFLTAPRIEGSWRVNPPLKAAAFLQIEHYQDESAIKFSKNMTAFKILVGDGVNLQDKDGKEIEVPVSPLSVLSAPPDAEGRHGTWKWLDSSEGSLNTLMKDRDSTAQQLRELGRQPLTAETGNITTVTASFAADKANSAVEAWAWALKDALETAYKYTAMWLGLADMGDLTVKVYTDFNIGFADEKDVENLLKMREVGDLSQKTLWLELERRNVLGSEFDSEKETEQLLEEIPGEDDEDLAAAVV